MIIITCPVNKSALNDLIVDLSELLFSLIDSGLLLRGIITRGKIIHEHGIIFGPGLIDAYYLEKDKVIFPRILIDKQLVSEFSLHGQSIASEYKGREKKLLIVSDTVDGEYFINYFLSFMSFPRKDKVFDERFSEMILTGLKHENSRVHEKYQWMAQWHDLY